MAGSGRWQHQAKLDAALKFGPQRSALRESLREARENYGQTVRAGKSTATLTQQAANAARPEIEQAYAASAAPQQAGATLVSKLLAGLPGVADQFKGDQAAEAAQTAANLGASKARDLAMLTGQGVAAQAGAQFNQQLARSTLTKAVAGLLSKKGSLSGEEGAFASSEADKLAHEAESNEQQERASERSAAASERNSERSSTTSRENSKESNAAKRAANRGGYVDGVKLLTGAEHKEARSTIAAQQGLAGKLFAHGLNRTQVRESLEAGAKPKNAPAVPRYAADELMAAALDNAQYGHITPGTVSRLHHAGYSVKQLGLTPGPPPAVTFVNALRSSGKGLRG